MFNNLNLATALTLIGTIAAIAVPIVGVFFRRETHGQLDVLIQKEVFLINQLVGKLKNFSILIDEKPASEQVVWVTGWILNSGNYDISERIIEHPLKLQLPESMRWLRGDIEHCSSGAECSVDIVSPQELQFNWILLKSGEYIYFDALIECPSEVENENWEPYSPGIKIIPNSRIENIQTKSIARLSDLGLVYNPSGVRKSVIIPKLILTFLGISFITLLWMRVFFAYELDNLFGDGFLAATPNIERIVDGIPLEANISVDKNNTIKLTIDESDLNPPLFDEFVFGTLDELFSNEDIRIGKISARDRSKETFVVLMVGALTIGVAWGLLYIWFPRLFLLNSRKRRTASALFALKTVKYGKRSDS